MEKEWGWAYRRRLPEGTVLYETLAGGWPQRRLDELLPPHWKAAQQPEQEPDPAAAGVA